MIDSLVEAAAGRVALALRSFRSWQQPDASVARNLSFQLSLAFLEKFSDGSALMDVPFRVKGAVHLAPHLDAYLHSKGRSVLLVCGRVNNQASVAPLVRRMNRMTPELLKQIRERHRESGSSQSVATFRMALATTWRLDSAEWWCGDSGSKPRWSRDGFPSGEDGWIYRYRPVFMEHSGTEGTLYWLYAHSAV